MCSFSRSSSAARAASHSSRVAILWVVIVLSMSFLLSFALLLFETPTAAENGTADSFRPPQVSLWVMRVPRKSADRHGVVSEDALSRARAGDDDAFRDLVAPYRRELQLHCYRILGSLQDAEDAVQETLLAAWRGLEGFEEHASLRAWLYRIATNRCLNALRDRGRRPQEVPSMAEPPEPTRTVESIWLEPYPDALLEGLADTAPGPGGPLRDARGGRARVRGRAATPATPSAGRARAPRCARLSHGRGRRDARQQRSLRKRGAAAGTHDARRTPAVDRLEHAPLPHSARERELVGRFADAVERGDTDGVVSLLTDDAWLTMPPQPYEYQGRRWRLPGSCTTVKHVAAGASASSPPAQTANPHSAAISPTPTRRLRAPSG